MMALLRKCVPVVLLGYSFAISGVRSLLPRDQTARYQADSSSSRNWQIHRTIEQLQRHGMPTTQEDFAATTTDVLQVLQLWAEHYAGREEWRSLLNKRTLRHEVEESIVALHHLRAWNKMHRRTRGATSSFIAVDACCGKGVFSMLLSYLATTTADIPHVSSSSSSMQLPLNVSRIILLDKNPLINWDHIQAANANHAQEDRPFLELWPGTNLHEHDTVAERLLLSSSTTNIDGGLGMQPLAITGIHLCKTLSPALVGLVNALGKDTVPYLCLAPCCLPSTRDQQISIPLWEGSLQRQARMSASTKAKQQQTSSFACFVCDSRDHHVRNCPERRKYTTELTWKQAVDAGILRRKVPCWKCGQVGHRHADCPVTDPSLWVENSQQHHEEHQQPHMVWDFGSFVVATSDNRQPFEAYCHALSKLVQETTTISVSDAGLTSSGRQRQQHQENNWNQNRKSLFITITR